MIAIIVILYVVGIVGVAWLLCSTMAHDIEDSNKDDEKEDRWYV